jgi:hypothetical protein
MTNNFTALRPKLLDRFRYDQTTGFFFHKRTAYPYHREGDRAEQREGHALVLRHDGLKLSTRRVAWLFVKSEWPTGHLTTKNGDPDDNRFENLVPVREVSAERRRRACKTCGAEFVMSSGGVGKFCSRACAVAVEEKPLPTHAACLRCQTTLPVGEYPLYAGKLRRVCRPCIREHDRNRRLAKNYGLSVEAFEKLLADQNFVCAICGEAPEDGPKVDHDHTTGAVRGILCGPCNTGLGHFKDRKDLLVSAAAYLTSNATPCHQDTKCASSSPTP